MNPIGVIRHILQHPLNRDRSYGALRDYLGWQARSRLTSAAIRMPFVNDAVLMVRRGMHGATQNIYCGLADFEEMSFLLHLLRPGDLFVDVGANVGSYTALASAVCGARTIAFEPNPATWPDLQANIAANQLEDRVTAHQTGAGSKPGTLQFRANGTETSVASAPDGAGQTFESPVITLDGSLADASPALIKIDVEGFESDVLAGARRVLDDPQLLAVIMENNDECLKYGFTRDQSHRVMLSHGFRVAHYDPRQRKLDPLPGRDPASQNSIYVRDLEAASTRLASAATFTVKGQVI